MEDPYMEGILHARDTSRDMRPLTCGLMGSVVTHCIQEVLGDTSMDVCVEGYLLNQRGHIWSGRHNLHGETKLGCGRGSSQQAQFRII